MHTPLQKAFAVIEEGFVFSDIFIPGGDILHTVAFHTPVAPVAAVGAQGEYFAWGLSRKALEELFNGLNHKEQE